MTCEGPRTPSTPRRRLKADERRARILDAASDLFAEGGYEGASMNRIARAAGVSAPVIYDHFSSKKDLYTQLLELHTLQVIEATTASHDATTVEELLRANVDAFFRFVEEHPAAWRMLFRDPAPDPEIAALQRRVQAEATARLADALVARIPNLRLSIEIDRERANELIAELGKTGLNGLAAWWWDHRDVPREALVAIAMDVMWVGLRQLGG
jgi:AcrR family transcriptional regulator